MSPRRRENDNATSSTGAQARLDGQGGTGEAVGGLRRRSRAAHQPPEILLSKEGRGQL